MSLLAALAAIAPIIIGPMVSGVEKLFDRGTGETKKQIVMASAKETIQALAKAGKLPGLPDDRDIEALVEAQVAAMKAAGGEVGNPAAPTVWALQIPPGCEVLIRPR